MFKSPLLLPLFSVVFQRIYVKKSRGWCNSPRKNTIAKFLQLPELLGKSFNLPKFHWNWDDMHHPCLACTSRHHFLKFKIKEPLMFLSSSDMRGGKFISVYPVFSWVACFLWKQAQFMFQSYDGARHKAANAFVKKKKHILIKKRIKKSAHANACFFSTDNQSSR